MKRDVGMACKKIHGQGKIKVIVNIQSLIHPYIFSQKITQKIALLQPHTFNSLPCGFWASTYMSFAGRSQRGRLAT